MRILAISGSLQSGSANEALLRAVERHWRDDADVVRSVPLDRLPHFNPDVEGEACAEPVGELRGAVRGVDGVVIATPEYAHGMPGVLKNALDWLVGSGDLYGKPVVVLSAAPSEDRGGHARAWTEQTLRAQGADVRFSATVALRRGHPGDLDAPAVTATLARARSSLLRAAGAAGADGLVVRGGR